MVSASLSPFGLSVGGVVGCGKLGSGVGVGVGVVPGSGAGVGVGSVPGFGDGDGSVSLEVLLACFKVVSISIIVVSLFGYYASFLLSGT